MGKKGQNKTKGRGGRPNQGRGLPPRRTGQDEPIRQDQFIPLQDRIATVKPFWRSMKEEDRKSLLTVKVSDLIERARIETEKQQKQAALEEQMYPEDTITIDLEPSPSDTLELGLERLKERTTWKLWKWPEYDEDFLDAETFRTYVEKERMTQEMKDMLPRDAADGKPTTERPAEKELRERMSNLLQKVHAFNRNLQDQEMSGSRKARAQRATADQLNNSIRDANIELIMMMMTDFEKENEHLYRSVLFPITKAICELLDPQQRESKCNDLSYDDFEKMHPDDVARFCEWLTEKVDGYSSKIKLEAKDMEEEGQEEGIGDVDLFTLIDDPEKGKCLVVNAKWLQHLQDRVLGEDGQPRKMKDGEDPDHIGLVLEWVYGTIVSTAEKARDGAKRLLGTSPPTVHMAFDMLDAALKEQNMWEEKLKQAQRLLKETIQAKIDAGELAKQYPDMNPTKPPGQADGSTEPPNLPDEAIKFLLKREVLLTEAKMMTIDFEKYKYDRELRTLKVQMRQGEPEFERLKREMDELKQPHRKSEGPFRSAHELERHQAQQQDAQVEEQLQVQTQFREHSSKLQSIFDKRQRVEVDITRKHSEERQLVGWKDTVRKLIDKFDELSILGPSTPPNGREGSIDSELENGEADEETANQHRALMNAARESTGQAASLQKLRTHFHKDVRRQFYSEEDDISFKKQISHEKKEIEKMLEDGRAVLQLLEMHLVNVACNDPGAVIGNQLILPLLQERLDEENRKAAERDSEKRAADVIKREEEAASQKRLQEEKKQEKKRKQDERLRAEKERQAAEIAEKEQAVRLEAEAKERRREEEEERIRTEKEKQEQEKREVEEKQMEARRKELESKSPQNLDWIDADSAAQIESLQASEAALAKPTPEPESSDTAKGAAVVEDDDEGFQQQTSSRHNRRARAQKAAEEQIPPPGFPSRPRALGDGRDGRGGGRRGYNHDGRNVHAPRPHPRVISVPRRGIASPPQDVPPEQTEAARPMTPPPQEPHKPPLGPSSTESPVRASSSQASRANSGPPSPVLESQTDVESSLEPQSGEISHKGSTSSQAIQDTRRSVDASPSPVDPADPSASPVATAAQDDARQAEKETATSLPKAKEEELRTIEASFMNGASPNTPQQIAPPNTVQPPSGERAPLQSPPVSSVLPLEGKVQLPLFVIGPPKEGEGVHPIVASVSQAGGQAVSRGANGVAYAPAPPPSPPNGQPIQAHPSGEQGRFRPSSKHSEPSFGPQAPNNPQAYGRGRGGQYVPDQHPHPSQSPQHFLHRQRQQGMPMQPGDAYGQHLMMPAPQMGQPMLYPPPTNMPQYPGPGMDTMSQGRGMPSQRWPGMGGQDFNAGYMMQTMGFTMPGGKRSMEVSSVTGFTGAGFGHAPQGYRSGINPNFLPQPGPPHAAMHPQRSDDYGNYPGEGNMTRRASQQSTSSIHRSGSIPATALSADARPFIPGQRVPDGNQLPRAESQATQPSRSSPLSHTAAAFELNRPQASSPLQTTPTPGAQQIHPTEQVIVTPTRQDAERAAQENAFRQREAQLRSGTPGAASATATVDRSSDRAGITQSKSQADLPVINGNGIHEAQRDTDQLGTNGIGGSPATQQDRSDGTFSAFKADAEPSRRERGQQEADSSHSNSPTGSTASSQTKAAAMWSNYRPPVETNATSPPAALFQGKTASGGHPTGSGTGQAGRVKQKRSTPRNLSSSSLKQEEDVGQSREPKLADIRAQKASRPQGASTETLRVSPLPIQRQPGSPTSGLDIGGVTWKLLTRDEIERLTLVRGLENRTGLNNCFLNVVIQSLWHLSTFREKFLQLNVAEIPNKGGDKAAVAVLTSLHSVLNDLDRLRTAFQTGDAKRIKLEDQEKGFESQEPDLVASPKSLRLALSKYSRSISEATEMGDAQELVTDLLEGLHKAYVGGQAKNLDQLSELVGYGDAREYSYDPSIVFDIFAMHIQVPENMWRGVIAEEFEARQQPKRSKGTGGAVVDRWQTQTSRPQKSQQAPSLPHSTSTKSKAKGTFRYPLLTQRIDSKEYVETQRNEALKLNNVPQVYIQSLSWPTMHVTASDLEAVLRSFNARVNLHTFFGQVPEDSPEFELQAVICYLGHHYQAFVYSHEIEAWLLINDIEVTKVGSFGDVKQAILKSYLMPNVLFYERV